MRTSKNKLARSLDREDFSLTELAWPVAEEYRIDSEGKVAVSRLGRVRFYAPLEDPDVFFSFARLASRGRPSDKGILRWVDKHGLPKAKEPQNSLPFLPDSKLNQAPQMVEDLRAEALQAHSALDLYADLYNGDIGHLRTRIGRLREDHKQWKQLSEIDEWLVEEWGHEADGHVAGSNLPWMAEVKLEVFVSRKVDSVRPALAGGGFWDSSDDSYRPKQSWRCPDLLSAMYLQFYLLITNSLPIKRCENPSCRMPIQVTRKNRKFCNSTCRSNKRHYPEPD